MINDMIYVATFLTVIVAMIIGVWWCWYAHTTNFALHAVRYGRWMNDTIFRAHWNMPVFGGFKRMHFPGVVCILAGACLDGMGDPYDCSECVLIIADDVTSVAYDVLEGRFDGRPFMLGAATMAIWRRLGNAEKLAREIAAQFHVTTVWVVKNRHRKQMVLSELETPCAVSAPQKHKRTEDTSRVLDFVARDELMLRDTQKQARQAATVRVPV